MIKLKTFLITAVLVGICMTIMGCNTTEGFGKDTQQAGEKIQQSAEEHK
jgi:predicted small secreted protein